MIRCFALSFVLVCTSCADSDSHLALGTLERDRVAHTAPANEVVVELPVEPGSFVTKGTVLVKLDDRLQKTVVAKAQADVTQAEAELEKLRNGAREEEVAAAQARVASARAESIAEKQDFTRAKDLVARDLASHATLDQARAKRDAANANLRNAQEQLRQLTNGTREEDLRIAAARLSGVLAVLGSEEKRLSDLTVVATRDGVLDNLPWNLGERVTEGSPLAVLLAGNAPYARVYVPAPYRVNIKNGDELLVEVDGVEASIVGTVRWVSNDPAFTPYYALNQEERSRLVYLLEVQLPDEAAYLPNGVPAQVRFP